MERTAAYSYQDLAAGFQRRIMAPFLVTIEPADSPLTLNVHSGQEFNYVLEGEIELSVGGHVTRMRPGDSIMFDSLRPHGLRAIGSTKRDYSHNFVVCRCSIYHQPIICLHVAKSFLDKTEFSLA